MISQTIPEPIIQIEEPVLLKLRAAINDMTYLAEKTDLKTQKEIKGSGNLDSSVHGLNTSMSYDNS